MPFSRGRRGKAASSLLLQSDSEQDDRSSSDPDSEEEPLHPENYDNPDSNTNLLLANAIQNLNHGLRKLQRPSYTKVKDPEPFDGTNPSKLREFLVSCSLVFSDRPDSFRKDNKKVRYVISYLKGSALDWFEPVIMGDVDETPDWLHNFPAFVQELTDHFGPYDFRGDAETALNDLTMKDHHHITKYIVDFNKLASRTDWNEPALRDRFFRGLPTRIRTELLRGGKPKTLVRMRLKAQQVDQAYWMTKDEVKDSRTMPDSDNDSDDNSEQSNSSSREHSRTPENSGPHSRPNSGCPRSTSELQIELQKTPENSGPNSGLNSSSHLNSSDNSSSSSESHSSSENLDISDMLDEDGKLKADERKRRLEKDLCLYCGTGGHSAKECHKAPSTRIRTAEASLSTPSSDSEAQPSTPESSDSEN